jgi:hypothetical protein
MAVWVQYAGGREWLMLIKFLAQQKQTAVAGKQ